MSEYGRIPPGIPYLIDDGTGAKCPLCGKRLEPREVYHDSAAGAWGHKACVLGNRSAFTVLRTAEVEKRLGEREGE